MDTGTVKTLIAALKTERDALTRAIVSLEQIGKAPDETPAPQRARRQRAIKHRTFLTPEAKRSIVAEMVAQGPRGGASRARGLARRYGCPASTINAMWKVWQRKFRANSAAHDDAVPNDSTANV